MNETLGKQLSDIDGALKIAAAIENLQYPPSAIFAANPEIWERALEGRVGNQHWLKIVVWTTPTLYEISGQFNLWVYVARGMPAQDPDPDKDRAFTHVAIRKTLVRKVEYIPQLLRSEGEDGLRTAFGIAPKTPFTLVRPVR